MQDTTDDIINIFSINDFHGVIERIGWIQKNGEAMHDYMGVAMFSKLLGLKEKNEKNNIIVSAGDMLESPSLGVGIPGKITIPLMNLVKCAAMTIGNHEFDWIPWNSDFFIEVQDKMNFPLLSCNLYDKKIGDRASFAKPSTIINIAGFKLALIGLTTEECHTLCLNEELGDYQIRDPISHLKQEIKKVKEEGAEIIIVVAHIGVVQDPVSGEFTGEIVNIIKNFNYNEIQGVITAHSHQLLSGQINGIPIVQGGAYGNGIGHIQINIDSKKRRISSIDTGLIKIENVEIQNNIHPKIKEIVDHHVGIYSNTINNIGYTHTDLNIDYMQETYWGKFVANVIREEVGAEIGFINTGAFRSQIKAGAIYDIDIKQNLPFDNTICSMLLKGKEIKSLIEKSIALQRGPLQTDGIIYYIVSKNHVEQRIESVKLKNDAMLEQEKTYKVATSNFLAGGGDFFSEFKNGVKIKDSNIIIRNAVISQILKKKIIGI